MKKKHIFILITIILLITAIVLLSFKFKDSPIVLETPEKGYVASDDYEVILYDSEFNETDKLIRGSEVYVYSSKITNEDEVYKKVKYNNKEYLVNVNNLVKDSEEVVKENTLYVRTSSTIYKTQETAEILSHVKKGEKVEIIGFDKLNEDGSVNKYKIKYDE